MAVPSQAIVDRYLASLSPDGECLVSSYSCGSHGYTQIGGHVDGRRHMWLGHRVAWFAEHGEMPVWPNTIDHICRNRRCGNPAHLRVLDNKENAAMNVQAERGKGVSPYKDRR